MSWTVASSHDFRNADDGGAQFFIGIPGTRLQAIRSQAGWVTYRQSSPGPPAAKTRAHLLAVFSIFRFAESVASFVLWSLALGGSGSAPAGFERRSASFSSVTTTPSTSTTASATAPAASAARAAGPANRRRLWRRAAASTSSCSSCGIRVTCPPGGLGASLVRGSRACARPPPSSAGPLRCRRSRVRRSRGPSASCWSHGRSFTSASAVRSSAVMRSTDSSVKTSDDMPNRRRARASTRPWRRLMARRLRAMPNSHAEAGAFRGRKRWALARAAANVSAVRSAATSGSPTRARK